MCFFLILFFVISLHAKKYTPLHLRQKGVPPKRDDSMRSNLLFPPLSLAVRDLRKTKRHELLLLLLTVVVVVVVAGGGGGGVVVVVVVVARQCWMGCTFYLGGKLAATQMISKIIGSQGLVATNPNLFSFSTK